MLLSFVLLVFDSIRVRVERFSLIKSLVLLSLHIFASRLLSTYDFKRGNGPFFRRRKRRRQSFFVVVVTSGDKQLPGGRPERFGLVRDRRLPGRRGTDFFGFLREVAPRWPLPTGRRDGVYDLQNASKRGIRVRVSSARERERRECSQHGSLDPV